MTPAISVVMPSHRRSASLVRALRALAAQTLPPSAYEVVVVLDGSHDDSEIAARSLALPYALRVETQEPRGPAAARNRGVSHARAPLLLFLDDDMEPAPELLAQHLAAQAVQPGVVLGYFHTPAIEGEGLLALHGRLWWANALAARARAEHRFTFRDLWMGNVSMPRVEFEAAGRFDERFDAGAAGEDWELGVRLLERRVPFSFAPAAACTHHDHPSERRVHGRAVAEGRGHALLARAHPTLFGAFRFSRPARRLVMRPLWHLIWWRPALVARMLAPCWALLRPLERLRLRRWWRKAHGVLLDGAYWCGVSSELGDVDVWRRLAAAAPAEPPGAHEEELDVAGDLSALDEWMARRRVDALRLRYGAARIGRLGPWHAAEPLRAAHVRAALVGEFRLRLYCAMARDGRSAAVAAAASGNGAVGDAGTRPRGEPAARRAVPQAEPAS